MNTKENVLEVKHLTKIYGTYKAVDDISFVVPKGSAIGLLGPNGAGKTTTIQVLLGVTLSNGGSISYFGMNFEKHRQACLQMINFASSFNSLQGRITVWENLIVYAGLYEIQNPDKRIKELAETFEVADLFSMRYWDISAGQKTRVNLVKAFINDPELILFDEPTASLDPDISDKLLSLIERLKKERNLSLLYTSHDMDEVARVCDDVIFLDHGKIVAHDTPLGLTKRIEHSRLTIVFEGSKQAVSDILSKHDLTFTFPKDYSVNIKLGESLIPKIIFNLSKEGIWITDITIHKPTLEDVFLSIARGSNDFSLTH
ncbi:ABC transporter ATP-binding protein [Candidatus Uhrbacteria bacterium]|nr:ABC transporter ATP-binding protein [Candidatus Uhrbacteria bacterium]